MAATCIRSINRSSLSSLKSYITKSKGAARSTFFPPASAPAGVPTSATRIASPPPSRRSPSFSRFPVELGCCSGSLFPLHSAVAAARMTSRLSSTTRSCRALSQGVWWHMWGDEVPTLQQLAIKLHSQPCSASACERNWSAFDAAHTKKRNRLEPKKLHDLVFVRMNLHFIKTTKDKEAKDSKPIDVENILPFEDTEVGADLEDVQLSSDDESDDIEFLEDEENEAREEDASLALDVLDDMMDA